MKLVVTVTATQLPGVIYIAMVTWACSLIGHIAGLQDRAIYSPVLCLLVSVWLNSKSGCCFSNSVLGRDCFALSSTMHAVALLNTKKTLCFSDLPCSFFAFSLYLFPCKCRSAFPDAAVSPNGLEELRRFHCAVHCSPCPPPLSVIETHVHTQIDTHTHTHTHTHKHSQTRSCSHHP